MTWVGNIYQKFEAVCQEVNDIVSQDTKKYVGNQVQNVSESLKRFCSNVVQEAQATTMKKLDAFDNYLGIENNSIGSSIQQSPVADIAVDPVETQHDHVFSGLGLVHQLITSPSVDCLEDTESGSILEKGFDLLANEMADISEEENAMEKSSVPEVLQLNSPRERESFEALLFSELIADNHETVYGLMAEVSPATSVKNVEFESHQMEEIVGTTFSGDTEKSCDLLANEMADIIFEENAMEEKSFVPEVLELNSLKERESFEASFFTELVNDKLEMVCGLMAEVPPATSLKDAEFESHQKEEVVGTTFSDEKENSCDSLANEMEDISVDENFMEEKSFVPEVLELISPRERESFEASLLPQLVDDNHEIVCGLMTEVPPATSVKGREFESHQNEGVVGTTFSDDTVKSCYLLADEMADINVEENATEQKSSVPEVLELNSSGDRESFEVSLVSELVNTNHENACGLMAEVPPATSVDDVEFESRQKEGTVGTTFSGDSDYVSDISSTLKSSKMDYRVEICEQQITESKLVPSKSSPVTESYHLFEKSSDNLPTIEVLGNNWVDVSGCDSSCSSALRSPISEPVISLNKAMERRLLSSGSVLPLEPHEEDVSRTKETLPLTGLSENGHPQVHCSSQLKAVNSSDVGCSDHCTSNIADEEEMETIQLSDKVKAEESCVVVDSCELYAVSRRALRSYKKIIQDVFAKKKRLMKEYEQLAIWHGDIDSNFFPETSQSPLPSTSTALLDSNSLQMNRTTDPEWELL